MRLNLFDLFSGLINPEGNSREIESVTIIEDLSPVKETEEVIEDWTEGNPNKIIVDNYEYLFSKLSRR